MPERAPDSLERRLFMRDAVALVDYCVDLVIELIGGRSDAASLLERALDRGRHVVTAKKTSSALRRPRLRALAAMRSAALRFDAAVAGAIPLLRTLSEALAGDEVLAVSGIVTERAASFSMRWSAAPRSTRHWPARRNSATPRPMPPTISTAPTPCTNSPRSRN